MKSNTRKQWGKDFTLDSTCVANVKKEYNGLKDPNLVSFFASPSRIKLLIKQKLVKII